MSFPQKLTPTRFASILFIASIMLLFGGISHANLASAQNSATGVPLQWLIEHIQNETYFPVINPLPSPNLPIATIGGSNGGLYQPFENTAGGLGLVTPFFVVNDAGFTETDSQYTNGYYSLQSNMCNSVNCANDIWIQFTDQVNDYHTHDLGIWILNGQFTYYPICTETYTPSTGDLIYFEEVSSSSSSFSIQFGALDSAGGGIFACTGTINGYSGTFYGMYSGAYGFGYGSNANFGVGTGSDPIFTVYQTDDNGQSLTACPISNSPVYCNNLVTGESSNLNIANVQEMSGSEWYYNLNV